MERVSFEDVEREPADGGGCQSLTDALATEHVAINRYVLAPGERFSGSVHAHMDQEEVFLVLAGEATFETREEEVIVGASEAIRFSPGEFQSGRNDGDRRLEAIAIGAPRDSDDVRIAEIPVLDTDVSCPAVARGRCGSLARRTSNSSVPTAGPS